MELIRHRLAQLLEEAVSRATEAGALSSVALPEIMLGVKIENVRALANAEPSARVPGLAYAEWGVGDMTMSFGYPNAHDPPYPQEIVQARERVKAACRESGVNFLDVVSPDTVVDRIEEGEMIGSGGQAGEETARIGRAYTKRTMPV